jgi:hypothetical protein
VTTDLLWDEGHSGELGGGVDFSGLDFGGGWGV